MRISDWSSDVCSSDLLVPVHKVSDLTALGPHVERELALVKVASTGDHRIEALRLADVYRARVIDATIDSFVFELTGGSDTPDTFINLMRHVRPVELPRPSTLPIPQGPRRADSFPAPPPRARPR